MHETGQPAIAKGVAERRAELTGPEQPAIGRVVHYVLPEGPHRGQHRPAVVVRVWSHASVNLLVFFDGTNDLPAGWPPVHWVTSVLHAEAAEGKERTWHWPERV